MTLKFLGGTRQVGRSSVAVKSGGTQLLLDYGILMGREPGFPMHIPPGDVNGIVLTHSHLDHSGAIPIFHIAGGVPVYGTRMSFDLTKLLITDFIRLSGYYLPFEFLELQTMMSHCVHLGYRRPVDVGGLTLELFDAGHIPGSAQAVLTTPSRRLLYTSDFNTRATALLRGADQDYGKIDVVVMESTYASEDHADRDTVMNALIEKVREVVERGGTVLIPAFSVGRSQEILSVLAAHDFEYPVAVDGMAKDANAIIARYSEYLRDPQLFKVALNKANWVQGWKDRRLAVRKPGVIVSPAGMLKGGNAIFYMNNVARKEENAIFLISYQVPGSPGRRLLDTGKFILGGKTREVKAEVQKFDFTSHCGRNELLETAKLIDGDAMFFVMHGAEENCHYLAEVLRTDVGVKSVVPKVGDVYTIG
jgi:putative mRNA 3-end processing factor